MDPSSVEVRVTALPREQGLSGRVTLIVELKATVGSVSRVEWPTDLLDQVTSRTWVCYPTEISGPRKESFIETWQLRAELEPFVVGPDQVVGFNPLLVWMTGEAQPRKLDIEPVLLTITSRLTADRSLVNPPTDYDDNPLSQASSSLNWTIFLIISGIVALVISGIILRKLRSRRRVVTPLDRLFHRLANIPLKDVTIALPPLLREYVSMTTSLDAEHCTIEELKQMLATRQELPSEVHQAMTILDRLAFCHYSQTPCDDEEAAALLRQTQEFITASRVNHS